MKQCPACQSNDTEQARNDAGFFKSPSQKPVRIYQWRCLDCGFIGLYAPPRGHTTIPDEE